MERIKELFSKHPYLASGGAVVVFVIFYYLFSRSGSGGATTISASSGTDAQTAAINAQESIAQLQSQTQLGLATIQANTATEQINAAHDVALTTTNAQLEALKSNNETQLGLAQVQAGVTEASSKSLEDIVTAQYSARTSALATVYDYLKSLASNQADVQKSAISARTTLDQRVIDSLSDVHNSALRAGVLNSIVTGDSSAAVSSQQGVAADTINGQNNVTSIVSGVLSALF